MRYLLILFLSLKLFSYDVMVVPTLSSNPTSGTGFGAMSSIIYQADETSSPSQAIVLATYTNSGSYNLFAINNMFFSNDDFQANTVAGYIYNNSEFDLSSDIPPNVTLPDTNANFQTKVYIFNQQLLYQMVEDIYVGGQFFYTNQSFDSTNRLGSAFLVANGIEDSALGAVGLILNYDTRSKAEKLFPRNSTYATFTYNYSPKYLGNSEDFTNLEVDYRKYIDGFKKDDVVALQAYLKSCSANTPDGSLAALGIKNVLRGFSIGQYKARNMAALQSEYRYALSDTDFIFTAFAGYANLSGGSNGTSTGNRDSNNGDYISGGIGGQYFIQKKAGVVYRVDLVTTNKNEQSVYATVNQAF